MPITFALQKRKQQYLIGLFLLVIVITAVVLFFGFFYKNEAPSQIGAPLTKEPNIDFNFLQNNQFLKEATPFETILPYEATTGRSNPFLPF